MSNQTKKLLNEIDQCVQESLEGLVAVQPGLCLLDGYPVVVREDVAAVKAAGKVTLLSGGGSGHEPAHAGKCFCSLIIVEMYASNSTYTYLFRVGVPPYRIVILFSLRLARLKSMKVVRDVNSHKCRCCCAYSEIDKFCCYFCSDILYNN